LAALYTGIERKWFLFFLASLAMLYTQNYSVFYLAVIGFVLIVMDWSRFKQTVIALAGAGLLYLPWALVVAKQMTEINGRYWIMDAGPGAVLGAVYKQFFASAMLAPGLIPSYAVVFAVLIIGVYFLQHSQNRLGDHQAENNYDGHTSQKQLCGISFVVLTMAFAPLAIAWIVSLVWQPVLLFRPLIGISPFLYLIAAWPAEYLFRNLPEDQAKNNYASATFKKYAWCAPQIITRRGLYAACFLVPMMIMGTAGYFQNIAAMKGEGAVSPMLDTLDYIRANWQEGDVLYYTDDGPMINLMPYAADLPQYKMPACDERVGYAPVLGSLSDSTREAIGIKIADLKDVPHQRAWIFAPRSPLHPKCYDDQIAQLAPAGEQVITVDDNEYITSGVWLEE
jgi:hypothetical protein